MLNGRTIAPLVLLVFATGTGCSWCFDYHPTAEADADAEVDVGRRFILVREMPLSRGESHRWPMLDKAGATADLGVLPAGTRLTIVKQVQCGVPFARSLTLARVDDGPRAGQLIATDRAHLMVGGRLPQSGDIAPWRPPIPARGD